MSIILTACIKSNSTEHCAGQKGAVFWWYFSKFLEPRKLAHGSKVSLKLPVSRVSHVDPCSRLKLIAKIDKQCRFSWLERRKQGSNLCGQNFSLSERIPTVISWWMLWRRLQHSLYPESRFSCLHGGRRSVFPSAVSCHSFTFSWAICSLVRHHCRVPCMYFNAVQHDREGGEMNEPTLLPLLVDSISLGEFWIVRISWSFSAWSLAEEQVSFFYWPI